VARILLDESHGELLSECLGEREEDTWKFLLTELYSLNWEISFHSDGLLTDEILAEVNVLVLAAPTQPLSLTEVKAVTEFVEEGGSLLIANNYESLEQQASNSTNVLLEAFGLYTKQLLSSPPEEIRDFKPHYLSSGVRNLDVDEPVYLGTLNKSPWIVATLPETNEPFLASVDMEPGRVVAIGDFALFGDKFINDSDNKLLAINIFRWLARENTLDCTEAHVISQVFYGEATTFSITLSNPSPQRLENIRCLLESGTNVLIEEPMRKIRVLSAREKTRLQWTIKPQQLGFQNLKLIIDRPQDKNFSSLFFDPVAWFKCIPNADFRLIILDEQNNELHNVETEIPFEVQAVTQWIGDAQQVPLQFKLEYPRSHIQGQQIHITRWRLTALDPGNWPVTLKVVETEQHIPDMICAIPSLKQRIAGIQRDMVTLLTANVHHQASLIWREFDTDAIRKIPFRVLTPEEQVRLVYPPDVGERLLDALDAASKETQRWRPLVEDLLLNISPIYSVVHGCCIPYDPKLAAHLVKKHAAYEENIAYQFLQIEGDKRYDQIWLEQNIAALIVHEKYGHGFFFTQTTVGQQLATLYRHGLVRRVDYERLRSPYPKLLYEDYEEAIQALAHSAIIVNEGFSTWLEQTVLSRLPKALGQIAYQRKLFLFERDDQLDYLRENSEYFKTFPPRYASKYREAYEYLERIQSYFGFNCGPKCAIQAVVKAADVDFGISESAGKVQFALRPTAMSKALLKPEEGNYAGADVRLRYIYDVLKRNREWILARQEELQCHRSCLHTDCPVNKIINEKLGW
jgi:DNA-binding transcriptional ArsR family regulator